MIFSIAQTFTAIFFSDENLPDAKLFEIIKSFFTKQINFVRDKFPQSAGAPSSSALSRAPSPPSPPFQSCRGFIDRCVLEPEPPGQPPHG